IGEIPFELQGKLLRAIQEGRFERVGDERTHQVDVRIIAASNRDLPQEVSASRFRQDLYYRLSVFPIALPALRDRSEDIPELAAHFVGIVSARLGIAAAAIGRQNLEVLQAYSWPGNIRELQNVIERAVILARGGALRVDQALPAAASGAPVRRERAQEPAEGFVTDREFRKRERQNLIAALTDAGWKIYGRGGAAALLGMKPTTLVSRIQALGIERPRSASAHHRS